MGVLTRLSCWQSTEELAQTQHPFCGDLKGLGFGAGLFFIGDRQGDLSNTFTLPSYVWTDAAIFYHRDNWRVGLNIKNLFDVYYFESASSRNSVYPGAPFTMLGTVSVQF